MAYYWFYGYRFCSFQYCPSNKESIKDKKKSEDVSIWFIIFLNIGLSLWVVYGIGKNDFVIIIGNSIAVALNTCMLILKITYSRNPLDEES